MKPLNYALGGALLLGVLGFGGGFFGPMILTPEASQGPLVGVLVTGPLGFMFGGIGGGIWGLFPPADEPKETGRLAQES